jgi:preprotein translocase subunit SecA
MFSSIFHKVIPTKNERELRRMRSRVVAINELEPKMRALPDSAFPQRTAELRERFQNALREAGIDPGLRLTELHEKDAMKRERRLFNDALAPVLHETFALVREAGRRVLEMRHFDVQLVAAWCCTRGAFPR